MIMVLSSQSQARPRDSEAYRSTPTSVNLESIQSSVPATDTKMITVTETIRGQMTIEEKAVFKQSFH